VSGFQQGNWATYSPSLKETNTVET
jgi:hypothetical protein